MEACLLLLFSIVPVELTAREHFDLVELNHFYDENGKLVFDQAIWYRWCCDMERYQVVAWRLVKNDQPAYARDWEGGGYIATWNDGEVMRRVRADSFRESWTQFDPELAEREYLPKEKRPELASLRIEKVQAKQ
jgi:hypothetical protein